MRCVWQAVASSRVQWRSSSDHVIRLAPAFDVPANAICSPTVQVVDVAGVVIEAVGGAPTVIVRVAVPVSPAVSRTRRRTVTEPAVR